jgi:hypothetical protein
MPIEAATNKRFTIKFIVCSPFIPPQGGRQRSEPAPCMVRARVSGREWSKIAQKA